MVRDKTYRTADGGWLKAIEHIEVTAPAGSFTALIGPSGCGKSTTLRIVLGLDADYSGSVQLPGPAQASPRIAAVFQEPRLLPWRTVEENVRLALPHDREGADLADLFDVLGLAEMTDRYPSELSLGLARRVALARAFAIEPSLLVLDEPFVSLDEMTAERLRQLLLQVWSARPTTALMVTHNLREALQLSDRVVVLTERPATVSQVHEIAAPRSERSADWLDAAVRRFG